MAIDVEWALGELRTFVTLVQDHKARPGHDAELEEQAAVAELILDRVTPTWRTTLPAARSLPWTQPRDAAHRAIALLTRQEELKEKLGDEAPTLDASRLHPWAWEGARSLWQSRHYREAVEASLKKVTAEAQNKTGRHDLTETNLFKQLFSLDKAKPGMPRLRLRDDDGSKTYENVHRGAWSLAEGLFAGIRNVVSHTVAETEADEQVALEQLAAVSVLARWVDEARVVMA